MKALVSRRAEIAAGKAIAEAFRFERSVQRFLDGLYGPEGAPRACTVNPFARPGL